MQNPVLHQNAAAAENRPAEHEQGGRDEQRRPEEQRGAGKHVRRVRAVQAWKRKAKKEGDDWDKARSASRLADDVHWYSDTIGGAFLGFIIGRATFYDSEHLQMQSQSEPSWNLLPIISEKQQGFVFNVSF